MRVGVSDPLVAEAAPGFHVVWPDPRIERVGDADRGAPAIAHCGSGKRAEIALTFDDGPSRWTREIAGAFERHGCQATFFLSGAAVGQRPEVVAALAATGHELGNHLWSHPHASTLSDDEIRAEIERGADAIEAAGASRPSLLRPPTSAPLTRWPRRRW
jgi:peptidoglycan/xylan/chitin deacetylase (PgdA/CDA1 family)